MLPISRVFILCIGVLSPIPSFAFDICDFEKSGVEELRTALLSKTLRKINVGQFELAESIEFTMPQSSHSLFLPYASLQQRRVIMTLEFARTACQMALAKAVALNYESNDQRVLSDFNFHAPTRDASNCITQNPNNLRQCLISYGNSVQGLFRESYQALDRISRLRVHAVTVDSLSQIVMHEYAHHILDHYRRGKGENPIVCIDAEFEADFFAATSTVATEEKSSGLYYFFSQLAKIAENVPRPQSECYESSACRRNNIASISSFYSTIPIILRNLLWQAETPQEEFNIFFPRGTKGEDERLESIIAGHLSEGPGLFGEAKPNLYPACGRMSEITLRDAHRELQRLTERLYADRSALRNKEIPPQIWQPLTSDLINFAQNFKHVGPLAAHLAAELLERVSLTQGKAATIPWTRRFTDDREIASVFNAGDFGAMRGDLGVGILNDRKEIQPEKQLSDGEDLMKQSLRFNSGRSVVWMNLALVRFMRGDCIKALEYAGKWIETSIDQTDEESARGFLRRVSALEENNQCSNNGAEFRESFFSK